MIDIEQVRKVYDRHRAVTGYIRQVGPDDVGADLADHVLRTADVVSVALGLAGVTDFFFFMPTTVTDRDAIGPVKADVDHGKGFTWGTFVLIRADLSTDDAERVVAHELRHVWQARTGMKQLCTRDELERDAHQFDTDWMEKRWPA